MKEEPDLFGFPAGEEWAKSRPLNEGQDAIDFILAGKAKITIRSEKTGKHYTYKIRKERESDHWFVSRLSRNETYYYLGTIFSGMNYRATRRSEFKKRTWLRESHEAFEWFWAKLYASKRLPQGVAVFHAGRCGMCGIELTDPVSIKEGYGPDCRKKRLQRNLK